MNSDSTVGTYYMDPIDVLKQSDFDGRYLLGQNNKHNIDREFLLLPPFVIHPDH